MKKLKTVQEFLQMGYNLELVNGKFMLRPLPDKWLQTIYPEMYLLLGGTDLGEYGWDDYCFTNHSQSFPISNIYKEF